jgi:hypothetical protein
MRKSANFISSRKYKKNNQEGILKKVQRAKKQSINIARRLFLKDLYPEENFMQLKCMKMKITQLIT